MFREKFRLMAPEGEATGGGGTDFLGSMASQPGEPAGGQTDNTQPAAAPEGTPPSATFEMPDWTNATTEELRADPRFIDFAKQYGKFDEVVKSAMDLTAKAGDVPKTPDEYEIDLDPEVQLEESDLKEYRDLVHKLGLSKGQAKDLHKAVTEAAKKQVSAYQAKMEAAQQAAIAKTKADYEAVETTLKTEWGNNYQVNQDTAVRGIKAYGSPGLIKALQDANIGNNPEIIKHFYTLGKLTREDSALNGNGTRTREKSHEDIMYPKDPKKG